MTEGERTGRVRTDDLIHGLAEEAGREKTGRAPLDLAMVSAIVAALPTALAIVLVLVGARPGLLAHISGWAFQFKAIAMILLTAGALPLVRSACVPGMTPRAVLAVAPALLFLAANIVFDRSGLSILGVRSVSAPICVGTIVAASLPVLAMVLVAMRHGIPTHMRHAGFCAGLFAGALGALAYTIACVNDGAAFVTLWYAVAILVVAGIGAAIGRRALAW